MERVLPASQLKFVTIAATAGNTPTTIRASSTGHRARLIAIRVTLVCDATVANRNIDFQFRSSGAVALWPLIRGTAITAGLTRSMSLSGLRAISAGITLPNDLDYAYIDPIDLIFQNSGATAYVNELIVSINTGQAGDSYSGLYLIEEWTT